MTQQFAVLVQIHGRVQRVFFRAFVRGRARELGLVGYASNKIDGITVEVLAEGERIKLEKLIGYLNTGPSGAKVDSLEIEWIDPSGHFNDFDIKI